MTDLAAMLSKIRAALGEQADKGDMDGRAEAARSAIPALLPPVGETFDERLALFRTRSEELKTDFHLLDGPDETAARLKDLAAAEGWTKLAAHRGKLTDAALGGLKINLIRTDEPYEQAELEACDAGITECDALVAQTGSVLVTSRSAGGRALTVLPPHHVVLARREQLVGGLDEALARLAGSCSGDWPSMISFVTGPSRTGDIERILVLGAHGPKKLTVFCA